MDEHVELPKDVKKLLNAHKSLKLLTGGNKVKKE